MNKCPRCGSTQFEEIETNYIEDGWKITLYRDYECKCGCRFYGTSVFICQDEYEVFEEK